MKDKFLPTYQPRGLAYWEMLHTAINDEVVGERDRFFMYWLKTLGIEKGKPFKPTERQKRILIDGARQGELMAKTLVFNERMNGVLRQNNWRMILGGEWGDGHEWKGHHLRPWHRVNNRSVQFIWYINRSI